LLRSRNNLFVNISDIHINNSNINEIKKRAGELYNYINHLKTKGLFDDVVITISGDIANRGTAQEYELFTNAFSKILSTYKIICCPGNHDINFLNVNNNLRDILLEKNSS
jgi:predicted MPP superfamily phosphohydrolase